MKKPLKGKITISKPSSFMDEDYISITIEDVNSHVQFAEIRMNLVNFTKALMGQGLMDVDMFLRNLDVVGKKRESKDLIFPVPDSFKAKDYAEKHCQEFADEGWTADNYFRSQGSIRAHEKEGVYYAYGRQFRFVEDV